MRRVRRTKAGFKLLKHTEPTSAAEAESESGVTANSLTPNLEGTGDVITAAIQPTKGKHEKNSIEYCFSVSSSICVGTGFRDYHHNHHDRRQRNDHRVHSRKRD